MKKTGQYAEKGEVLAKFYLNDISKQETAQETYLQALCFTDHPPVLPPSILGYVNPQGEIELPNKQGILDKIKAAHEARKSAAPLMKKAEFQRFHGMVSGLPKCAAFIVYRKSTLFFCFFEISAFRNWQPTTKQRFPFVKLAKKRQKNDALCILDSLMGQCYTSFNN